MPVRDPNVYWPKVLSLASHELRTPAGVVSGYGRMLLQSGADALTPAQRKLLEAADRSSARVADLLVQMSELARLASVGTPLAPQETDLAALVEPVETIGRFPRSGCAPTPSA